MKSLHRIIAVVCGIGLIALTSAFFIQSYNFNSTQFSVNAPYLSITDGVDVTNAVAWNSFTINSTNANSFFGGTLFGTNGFVAVGGGFTGLVSSGAETNAAGSRVAYLSDVTAGSQTPLTANVNGALFQITNLSGLTIGTNASSGLLVIDGYGNMTQYSTNGSLFQAKDLNTNTFFSLYGTNQQINVRGLIQFPTNGVAIGGITDPGAGNLNASNTVSALGITNRQYSAIGVVTNDANGKEYTTPTLPSSLVGSGQAVYGGCTQTNEVINTTFFIPPNAHDGGATTDGSGVTRCIIPANGTLANLYVIASANPGAVANTVTIMTNGVATSITVAMNNVTSGSDTTHTIPVLAGWEVGIRVVCAASGTAVTWGWGFQLK